MTLALMVGLSGCSVCGADNPSSGGEAPGNRGSLSAATAGATGDDVGDGREEDSGREQGRTRTKTDHQQTGTSNRSQSSGNSQDNHYVEENEDCFDLMDFMFGMVVSLFRGSGDEEDSHAAPVTYDSEYSETGNRTWSNYSDVPEPDDDDGGGLDFKRGHLNLWYSPSWLVGDAIQGFRTFTVSYSAYSGTRYRSQLGIYYGKGIKGNQQRVQDGLSSISEAGLDIGTRGYFTPDHSLMGLYMLAGLRLGVTFWSYVEDIEAPNDDGTVETISGDGVLVFTPYLGLGTSLLQTKSVHLGLNFTVGGRLYLNRTFESFDNDLFVNVGEYRLNFEASVFF